ncbi:MAG TPA: AAA family ATPase, partial [Rhizomicrobium sp.]|nr:AAA family ATPase [Rhizomicrobium sp.]
VFPKLFLLDEPDAHLHPSMTRQFIDVLKNVLVDQYGVRVILTTHSPSTVALAPEESLYVMSRDQPRIRKPSSKAEAIGLLTSGLVIVSPGTRFVLVEDESDVSFYNMVRDILADQGPSKDRLALKPAPSLVFMPASAGSRATKVGGGKDAVRQWVDKFDTPPLREMFHGIIDLDRGNTASTRVHVLNRYSFENYLVDPFVVLGVLIEDARTPAQLSLQISPGDEHLIRSLSTVVLQSVVDYIAEQVEPELGALNNDERLVSPVSFTSGISLGYPNWMLTRRGHDLVSIYQTIFGQNTITPPRLKKSFRRIRLVPLELAQIMSDLQNS